MAKSARKRFKEAGHPPGTLVPAAEAKPEPVRITIVDYDERAVEQRDAKVVQECFPFKDKPTVTWINVDGIPGVDVVRDLGEHFGIHPLVLEDIVNVGQRPKMEDLGPYIYVVLNMLSFAGPEDRLEVEQVSLILGENLTISFQERPDDVFNIVRDRIVNDKGRIRKMGADYLLYSLIDAIVDNYFVVLEHVAERIEPLEEMIVTEPGPEALREIQALKRQMIFLRKSVWPLRDVINGLQRRDSPLITEATGLYLRDVYDHTVQVIESVETFREMATGMLEMHLSMMSNKMNEIMKVLTIIATVFIPLTFIAGLYGMNFKFMPEIEWRYGYPVALLVMWIICVLMLVYFRRKRWV